MYKYRINFIQNSALCLVPVGVRLVRSFALDTNVVCLLLRQCCELCTKSRQVKPSHLLIQLLGQEVHIVLVLLLLHILEKIELRKRLVGEGTRHDERRMASRTTK